MKDRATYTPAELERYGLPPRTPGEPFDKWASIVRGAGKRVCDYTTSSDRWTTEYRTPNWTGYYADEDTPGQTYTEADMDYYVSCIGTPPYSGSNAIYGAWIGIGGKANGSALVQTGTVGWQNNVEGGWVELYRTFVENTGASPPTANYSFYVSCGDHMYVKAYDSGTIGCTYIERINDGMNYKSCDVSSGPKSDEQSAEAIVEYDYAAGYPNLANFGTETFYGVGITDNGHYHAMWDLPYDYDNAWLGTGDGCPQFGCTIVGPELATTGPIQNDPGDVPYDQYSIYWNAYGTA